MSHECIYGECAHEQHVRRTLTLTLTHTITAYSVSGNVVRVRILICATRQKPCRKRVYHNFLAHLALEYRPIIAFYAEMQVVQKSTEMHVRHFFCIFITIFLFLFLKNWIFHQLNQQLSLDTAPWKCIPAPQSAFEFATWPCQHCPLTWWILICVRFHWNPFTDTEILCHAK